MNSYLEHNYPPILIKFPKLIYLNFLFNGLFKLRNWHVRKEIKSLLQTLDAPFHYVDAGTGDGQFLIPFTKKNKTSKFSGVDLNQNNINLLEALIKREDLKNTFIFHANVTDFSCAEKADLIICIGVLQYVEDDNAALQNLFKNLSANGKLIIYVPINERFITSLYFYLFSKYTNYEKLNNRQRVYSASEIISKIEQAGFKIESTTYTYGFWGILSHELFNILQIILINKTNLFIKLLAIIIAPISALFILFFMAIDYFKTNQNGNGLLIVSNKNSSYKY